MPPVRAHLAAVNQLYRRYCDRIAFSPVYIREAHPESAGSSDKTATPESQSTEPVSLTQRALIAQACVTQMTIALPVLLDEPENRSPAQPARLNLGALGV